MPVARFNVAATAIHAVECEDVLSDYFAGEDFVPSASDLASFAAFAGEYTLDEVTGVCASCDHPVPGCWCGDIAERDERDAYLTEYDSNPC